MQKSNVFSYINKNIRWLSIYQIEIGGYDHQSHQYQNDVWISALISSLFHTKFLLVRLFPRVFVHTSISQMCSHIRSTIRKEFLNVHHCHLSHSANNAGGNVPRLPYSICTIRIQDQHKTMIVGSHWHNQLILWHPFAPSWNNCTQNQSAVVLREAQIKHLMF